MALEVHLSLSDDINEFEKDFVGIMVRKRDDLWDNMGPKPTSDAQEQYTILNNKVRFLQGMVAKIREVMCYDAVLVDACVNNKQDKIKELTQ